MYHGSSDEITEIKPFGYDAFDLFGGIFAASERDAAAVHGDIIYRVESPAHLENCELHYEIEGAWDAALEIAGGDEALADCILDPECPAPEHVELPNRQWDVQRMRGELAQKLGYTSVEMRDEHGTTHLCLPGCKLIRE